MADGDPAPSVKAPAEGTKGTARKGTSSSHEMKARRGDDSLVSGAHARGPRVALLQATSELEAHFGADPDTGSFCCPVPGHKEGCNASDRG
jgi:hypothetical protein